MNVNQKMRSAFLCLASLALFMTVTSSSVYAASIDVSVQTGKVSVKATGASLKEVLAAMEKKTGLMLKTSPLLDDPVSCDIMGVSIEEAIKQLLFADFNYALFARKTAVAADRSVEYLLWIYERKTDGRKVAKLPQTGGPPNDETMITTLMRADFLKQFSDKGIINSQMSAETQVDLAPGAGGILVTAVEPDSALAGLGIAEGDLINEINGFPVRSVDDFATLLTPEGLGKMPTIMIRRYRQDQAIANIYINIKD